MLNVGLTGSIAVGKSYVVSVLRELGCKTFDSDKIAHSVMEPGREAYEEIVREFGRGVLAGGGESDASAFGAPLVIDRARLGAIVFADPARRARLNQIVHPHVIIEQNRLLAEAEAQDPGGIAIMDAALMIESGGYKRFDKLIVVYCDREVQVERLMLRNGISRQEADLRIAAQMSSEEKRRYADYEIDTSGSFDDTRRRVVEVYEELRSLQAYSG